jgi:hypothetical protein
MLRAGAAHADSAPFAPQLRAAGRLRNRRRLDRRARSCRRATTPRFALRIA